MAKDKPQFDGMQPQMQFDVMEQYKQAQPQEQAQPVVASANVNKSKVDNSGSIKIACTKFDERILKIVALKKNITIKKIVLDALALYYEQEANKQAFEDAKIDLTKYY